MTTDLIIQESEKFQVGNLLDLANEAKEIAKFARSSKTNKAYASDWNDFCYWCKSNGLNFLPATPQTIAVYLMSRIKENWVDRNGVLRSPLKVSTLRRRLAAISQAHKMTNHQFDMRHPDVQEVWKGIRNKIGVAQDCKDPILLEDLQMMVNSISENDQERNYLLGIRDKAILLIGFVGALRRSEIVALRMEDIKFVREGLLINIRKSKTDQEAAGRTIPLPYGSNILSCAVRALKEWLEASLIEIGPLFRYVNRHGQIAEKPLSSHSVAKIIKRNGHVKSLMSKAMASKNKSPNFSGHSLRAGFATQAAIAGIQEYIIAKHTGHKSNVIRRYIRIGNLWTENAATKIGL